jgi:hypothetical protein
MRLVKFAAFVLAAAIVSPVKGAAQGYYFGQNQVQFDKFQWKVIETAHFTIHYYPEERDGIMDARGWPNGRTRASRACSSMSSARRSP